MTAFIEKIQKIDPEKWARFSLVTVWVGAVFAPALMRVAFGFALVFFLFLLLKNRAQVQIRVFEKIDWTLWGPLVLFYALVLVSFFTSEYPQESLRGLWKIALPVLIFVMNARLFRSGEAQGLFFRLFTVIAWVVAADCLTQYIWGKDILRQFPAQSSGSGIRLVGPFGDFSKLAAYLLFAIPVFMMQFWRLIKTSGSVRRIFHPAALVGVSLVLLYLTRTRGALLALVVSIVCLFAYRRWFKALGAIFLLCLALLAVVPRNVIIHQDAQGKEQSLVERIELWQRAWNVIKAKPWTGTGINTYNVAHAKYDNEQNWRVRGYYAHNGYLQLAAETGIPCILAFLLFWGIYFFKALKHIKQLGQDPEALAQLGILTGLFAFLLHAVVDTNLQSPQPLVSFWFMAGILLARQQIVPGDLKA